MGFAPNLLQQTHTQAGAPHSITAPHSGVLIGKASNPAGGAGSRVCHIGVCKELPEVGEVKGGGFGPIKKLKATVINYGE